MRFFGEKVVDDPWGATGQMKRFGVNRISGEFWEGNVVKLFKPVMTRVIFI